MDIDAEIKKLKKLGPHPDPEDIPSPEKMALLTATGLDQAANSWAFKLFRDKKFRKLYKLESFNQTEQDRIFNELVIAAETLLMILVEARDLRVPEELKEYYELIKDQIPIAHDNTLKEMGVEKKYRRQWKKLIQMRYKEYSQDKLKARDAAMTLKSQDGELTTEQLDDINLLLPVQTVAIGCHHHICRNKTKGKDEAFKYLVKKLGRFYVEIRVPLEGGKINLINKLRVKLRKFFE